MIETFWHADRARRVVSGMTTTPLPLSVVEINAVVSAYGTALPRRELDNAVLALDSWYLAEKTRPAKQSKKDVGSAWAGVVAQVNAGGS